MSTSYRPADSEVLRLAAAVIEEHCPDLKKHGVTIEYLFARNEEGVALKLRGTQCAAIVRINTLKERVQGCKDAEISIDEENWEELTESEKLALLHHELHHLVPCLDSDDLLKLDNHDRPKLRMRPHDREYGWFDHIAAVHGMASPEVKQSTKLLDGAMGKVYFPAQRELPVTTGTGDVDTERAAA